MSPTRYYFMGPFENSTVPTIARDDPGGGDPIIIATLARVHRPDELHDICRLANERIERVLTQDKQT